MVRDEELMLVDLLASLITAVKGIIRRIIICFLSLP
jgi:hypothetical protein